MARLLPKVLLMFLFCTSLISASDRLLLLKIGPTWPRVLNGTDKPVAWDGTFITGATFDNILSLGGGLDFLWNVNTEEKKINGNQFRIERQDKTFMFPVSGYIGITPIPDVIVNPCLSGQIGLNMMYFSHKANNADTIPVPDSLLSDESGFYMGFYWKVALDAVVKIGRNTGLFAGVDFQWSRPENVSNRKANEFIRRDMYGVGIRMGLRAGF